MLLQPQTFKTIERAQTNIEKTLSGDDYLGENDRSEWRQEYTQLDDTYGVSDQLPYTQFERVLDPRKVAGQLNPLIKTPIEAMSGEYIYTGVPIESPLDYVLSQTAPTKTLSMASKKNEQYGAKDAALYGISSYGFGFPINRM